jgi:hypothetical protein
MDMRTTVYNKDEYMKFVGECKEVAGLVPGAKRGYVRLTPYAKTIGINKGQLVVVARALGLTVDTHGSHGTCAFLVK